MWYLRRFLMFSNLRQDALGARGPHDDVRFLVGLVTVTVDCGAEHGQVEVEMEVDDVAQYLDGAACRFMADKIPP